MSARQIKAILESVVDGDTDQLYATVLQFAAEEARLGHARVAKELRQLVDRGRAKDSLLPLTAASTAVPLAQPRGELANLLTVEYPETRLVEMVLPLDARSRLERVILEQAQSQKLHARNLSPRRKLLLTGPPGSGKTMTASMLAGELRLPLFTIRLEGLITKFMGETAQKLRTVFDSVARAKAVYLFDEFDALGSKRTASNDVGEVRRILNSFLQFLEKDRSQSIIVAATNHPELLDVALFRRFDDIIEYGPPDSTDVEKLMRSRLAFFDTSDIDWQRVVADAVQRSQADIVRVAEEAAKSAVLRDDDAIRTSDITDALKERRPAAR
jgi:SpoVK/Ycf46/Vps4 family AAA+-type ATPase